MRSALRHPAECLRVLGAFARAVFLASLPALPVVAYIEHNEPAVLIVCLLACACAGFILSSWLIIGTLLGVVAGFLFQPMLRSGTVESQAWDGALVLVFWTVAGVIAGSFISVARERSAKSSAKFVAQVPIESLLQQKNSETSN